MLLIANNWIDSGRHLDVLNPATDQPVGSVAEAVLRQAEIPVLMMRLTERQVLAAEVA